MDPIIPSERIESRILLIRSQKVMLDKDLAELYEIPTKLLNKAVRRNLDRFPNDFMFQLTKEEHDSLRFQFGTLKKGQYSKYAPLVFTEQGVAMLSSVLRSKRAIQVNVAIMRTFAHLRRLISQNKELARRLDKLEKDYDAKFKVVFDAIRRLMSGAEEPRRRIGFRP